MIISLSTKYIKIYLLYLKRGAIIETPLSNSEFVLAYLAVRLMPSALLEPSQLQLPPQLEDFWSHRYHSRSHPLPDTCL